jgi:hypothetical protein
VSVCRAEGLGYVFWQWCWDRAVADEHSPQTPLQLQGANRQEEVSDAQAENPTAAA